LPSDPTDLTCYENVTFCESVDDFGIEWIVEINETGTKPCPIGFVGIINCLLHSFEELNVHKCAPYLFAT
jgi:hypothetical protein